MHKWKNVGFFYHLVVMPKLRAYVPTREYMRGSRTVTYVLPKASSLTSDPRN